MSLGTIELKQRGKLRLGEAGELHLGPMSKQSAPTETMQQSMGISTPFSWALTRCSDELGDQSVQSQEGQGCISPSTPPYPGELAGMTSTRRASHCYYASSG